MTLKHSNATSAFDLNQDSTALSSIQAPPEASASHLNIYEQNIKTLPQPPALWQAFQQACDKGASSKVLGNIIKDDPVLAAAILRIVNAPGLGVRTTITDIGRAIAHLGTSLTRSIVSRHVFSSSLKVSGKVYDTHKLWKHGMAVSALAEIIAEHIPSCSAETASTLGLFHDIGKMCMNLITQYRLPATFDHTQGHLTYEFAQFNCTHIDLGVLLGKHWELPEQIIQGIAYHHHPAYTEASAVPEAMRAEVLAVYLADMLAIHVGLGTESTSVAMPHPSFEPMLTTPLKTIADSEKVQREVERIKQVVF